MNVLIIEHYGLGDAVLSLPVLAALRRGLPQAFLVGSARGGAAAVRQAFPVYDRLLSPGDRVPACAAVLDLTGKLHTARLARETGAALIIGTPWWTGRMRARAYYRPAISPSPGCHVTQARMELLTPLGVAGGCPHPELAPDMADMERAAAYLAAQGWQRQFPLVALHPGGHSRGRAWSPVRFAELACALGQRGIGCLIVAEAREQGLVKALAARIAPMPPLVALQPDLRLLAALLAHCQAFVGGDSGPLHLAGAVGTPVVGIYGRSDPSWSGPLGPRAQVAKLDLPCSPCRGRPHARFRLCWRRRRCMSALPARQVLAAVSTALEVG